MSVDLAFRVLVDFVAMLKYFQHGRQQQFLGDLRAHSRRHRIEHVQGRQHDRRLRKHTAFRVRGRNGCEHALGLAWGQRDMSLNPPPLGREPTQQIQGGSVRVMVRIRECKPV